MKNVRLKVRHLTCHKIYNFAIFEGKRLLFFRNSYKCWMTKEAAVRNAKAMAKRIGIPYDPEIIKQHGC